MLEPFRRDRCVVPKRRRREPDITPAALCRNCRYLNRITVAGPVPVAARCKAKVCGRSPAEILCSNPTAGMEVCCECCVLSGRGLRDALITRPKDSYRVCCVVVCDLETSRMRRPWPALGRRTTGNKNTVVGIESILTFRQIVDINMVEVKHDIYCYTSHTRWLQK